MTFVMNERRRMAVDALDPLPTSLTRLLAVTSSPDFDFGEVIDIVAHDMVLAGAVLRSANSAASAPSHQIHTVREAVLRLGAVQTMTAAMHSVVGAALHSDLHRYGLDAAKLWTHSCAASIAAGEVRRRAQLSLPTSISTTALLHDIGKIVLDRVAVDAPVDGLSSPDASADEVCEMERRLFGIDHAEMGALTAEMWNLPPAIVEGIAGHHRLLDDPLPSAVCLADHLAHLACDDLSPVALDAGSGAARSAAAILGITPQHVADAVGETRLQLDALNARIASTGTSR